MPELDKGNAISPPDDRNGRIGYGRISDIFYTKALTNVKRGTFREVQLYMVRWHTWHLAWLRCRNDRRAVVNSYSARQ